MTGTQATGMMTSCDPGSDPHRPIGRRLDTERLQWGSLVLLFPAVALLVVLFLIPIGYSFYIGLTNLRLLGPTSIHYQFTGLTNVYQLARDSLFPNSLELTALFVLGSVAGTVVMGLVLAMLMQRSNTLVRIAVGGVVVLAWMMPAVTAGTTWYASTVAGGTIDALTRLGQTDFLHSNPLLIVTLANTWSQCGFAMLVFGAALRNIPQEVVEAATLENATAVQRFRLVMLPLLRPTIVTTVLLITLLSLGNFALIYVMTQGGPNNATNILSVYSYQQAFPYNNLAYGALIGDVMVLITAVFGFAYVRALKARI